MIEGRLNFSLAAPQHVLAWRATHGGALLITSSRFLHLHLLERSSTRPRDSCPSTRSRGDFRVRRLTAWTPALRFHHGRSPATGVLQTNACLKRPKKKTIIMRSMTGTSRVLGFLISTKRMEGGRSKGSPSCQSNRSISSCGTIDHRPLIMRRFEKRRRR